MTCPKCSRVLAAGDSFCPTCGTPNPDTGGAGATASSAQTAQLPRDDLHRRLQAAMGSDYVVEHLLGEGGFAIVFAVTDRKLQRRIAVKVLRPEFTASPNSIQRFIREAESVAKITHPHILPIFFVGDREGLVYFAMPLVDGETLDARLRREGQLPEDEVIRLGSEIAEALAEAHGHGLVHRDIKPQNVMLQGAKKRALVMDFGIAKAAAGSGERLTGTGVIIGSPHYMSPEQAGGDPDLDPRSDLYSLGIVLWEMLAGEVPFDGPSTQGILIQHLTVGVPNIRTKRPTVSAALAKVVARTTEKKKDDRFADAHALSLALKEAQAGVAPAGGKRRSLPRALVLGAAAALVLLAGGAAAWRFLDRGQVAGGAHAAPAGQAARMAVLPFEALVDKDKDQFARTLCQLLTDALGGRLVPTTDAHELLGHWGEDARAVSDPLDRKAAFAIEHGANQMALGTATQAARQLRLAVDLYDTRDLHVIGHVEATGTADSLFGLVDRLATQIATAMCTQPEYNPQKRCFDVPPRASDSLAVTDVRKPGEVMPSPPTFLVRVDSSGSLMDVRTSTPSSHEDVNAAGLARVWEAKYLPARRRGTPVTAWGSVTVAVRTGDTAAAAGPCDVPGQNPGSQCFDRAPALRGDATARWDGAGRPQAPQLWVHVGADGKVIEVRVAAASNVPDFTEAAQHAARGYLFQPGQKGSQPVAAWVRVEVRAAKG